MPKKYIQLILSVAIIGAAFIIFGLLSPEKRLPPPPKPVVSEAPADDKTENNAEDRTINADTSGNSTASRSAEDQRKSGAQDGNDPKDTVQKDPEQKAAGSSRGNQFSGRGGRYGALNQATVAGMTLEAGQWSPQLPLFGEVIAQQQQVYTSPINSRVTSIKVLSGSRVIKGQTVLTLDNQNLQLNLRQQQARLADLQARIRLQILQQKADEQSLSIEEELLTIAKRSLDRYQNLSSLQLSSSTDYENALKAYQAQRLSVLNRETAIQKNQDNLAQLEAQKAELQAMVESVQLQLDDTVIKAPFDGLVAGIDVRTGDQVAAGARLAVIYQPDQLGILTRIPLKWTERLPADLSNVTATIIEPRKIPLTLTSVDTRVAQGSLTAEFGIEPASGLSLNRHVQLLLTLPTRDDVYAVPAHMVYENRLVFTIDQGRLRQIEVTQQGYVDKNRETWVLISGEDLKPGLKLLYTRLPNANDGLRVNLVDQPVAGKGDI